MYKGLAFMIRKNLSGIKRHVKEANPGLNIRLTFVFLWFACNSTKFKTVKAGTEKFRSKHCICKAYLNFDQPSKFKYALHSLEE